MSGLRAQHHSSPLPCLCQGVLVGRNGACSLPFPHTVLLQASALGGSASAHPLLSTCLGFALESAGPATAPALILPPSSRTPPHEESCSLSCPSCSHPGAAPDMSPRESCV